MKIDPSEFEARRIRALSLMEPDSALLLYSGVAKKQSADETYPFEVNKNFYYLSGIEQEGSALLLVNAMGERKAFLFVSPFDERKAKWYGRRLSTEEAAAISGCQNVLLNTSIEAKLGQLFDPEAGEYGDVSRCYLDFEGEQKIAEDTYLSDIRATLSKAYPNVEFLDAYPLVTTLRLRKSAAEIALLKEAIDNTKVGILSVLKAMRPGVKEYELADLFLHVTNDLNAYEGLSFNTIMASGKNATILHYPLPMDTLKDGDLLLMDLGSRKGYYCADISRTVPINGSFTPEQRKIYDIVLSANKMVASLAKPGVTVAELQEATVKALAQGCLEAGLIKTKDEISEYYFHGVSHLIGLDTHDPYKAPDSREYKNIPLDAGMVISDEPGLYFADKGIGVRIEDDLLITKDGCEVLSAGIPKEPSELEALLKSR